MTADLPRLERIRDLLADLDVFAPQLWDEAPSYRFEPPLDADGLAAAEAELGVVLPDDYRGFLTVVGTAGPGPDYGLAGPEGWAMPDELPTDSVTITTVDGATFTAGTGARPALAGEPDPARPFPLTDPWSPLDDDPAPVPAGAHLYDGCVHLNDIGCGYSSFLVITGEQRGTVWVDYSAGDGDIAPVASFLDWYEHWLDGCVTTLLGEAVRIALSERGVSPHDQHIQRWSGCFERLAAVDGAHAPRADLAALRLYQGRQTEAVTIINELAELERSDLDGPLEALSQWADRDGTDAATANPPGPAAATSPVWRIRRLLASNVHAPAHVLATLVHDERSDVRLAVAAHPHCPPAALAVLATEAEARWSTSTRMVSLCELDLVGRHPATPPGTLAHLVTLPERIDDELTTNVVRAVGLNPTVDPAMLATLAEARWPWVRQAVAQHPATPSGAVAALAHDTQPAVRAAVAARSDAVPYLAALAVDDAKSVRAAVAGNPTTPAPLLRQLGADVDGTVAFYLARNPAVPADVIEVLREHPDRPVPDPAAEPLADRVELPVRDLLQQHSVGADGYPHALLAGAIADPDTMVGYYAGGSAWLDDALLRALAGHPYSYARVRVCDHPTPPADVVIALTHDEAPMVVRASAARPEVPVDRLTALAEDENDECRWGVAANPHTPLTTLRQLGDDECNYVRRAVLDNPAAPPDLVDRLARDTDPLVRVTAGRRNDLSASTVASMLTDPDPSVARAARWFQGRVALREES